MLAAAQNWPISCQKVLVTWQLVGILVLKLIGPRLVVVLLKPRQKIGYEFIVPYAAGRTRQKRKNKINVGIFVA